MRLLVTGSAGYVGSEVASRARHRGIEVVGTWHRRPAADAVRMDIRDAFAVERVLRDVRPDAVVHTAFVYGGPDLWSATVEGSGVVAAASADAGVRLVHVSSDVVFDGEKEGRYRERDAVGPVHPYGEAKAAAETLVATACPQAAIARSALVVGGPLGNRQEQLVVDAIAGTSDTTFYTDELRTPVEVGDLAAALLELAASDFAGLIHLGGSDEVSRAELAALIATPLRLPTDRLREGLAPRGRAPRNAALDSSLASSRLETELRGVRQVFAT